MGDGGVTPPSPVLFTDIFNQHFPYYLSVGMTARQYWNEDVMLTVAYRRAQELRDRRVNREAWLHGAYVYNALCCASPLFHDLAPEGTQASPYLDRPFPLTVDEVQAREEEKMREAAEGFRALVAAKNSERKEGQNHGY